MSRKSCLLASAIVLALGSSVGSGLALLVRHEPASYQQAVPEAPDVRQKESTEFTAELVRLIDDIVNKQQWFGRFTDEQINSYLAEDFLRSGTAEKLLPEGIHEPRVAIQPDRIRLSFRYGTGVWSTVVSIDLGVWLAAKEPNVVVLELKGLRAGSLPISAQSLLERISEAARSQNLDVTWYRHNGNPVAVLRFQPYQNRPTFQLQRLELGEGTLLITGRSLDAIAIPVNMPTARLPSRDEPPAAE
jgi:hypothetical protein